MQESMTATPEIHGPWAALKHEFISQQIHQITDVLAEARQAFTDEGIVPSEELLTETVVGEYVAYHMQQPVTFDGPPWPKAALSVLEDSTPDGYLSETSEAVPALVEAVIEHDRTIWDQKNQVMGGEPDTDERRASFRRFAYSLHVPEIVTDLQPSHFTEGLAAAIQRGLDQSKALGATEIALQYAEAASQQAAANVTDHLDFPAANRLMWLAQEVDDEFVQKHGEQPFTLLGSREDIYDLAIEIIARRASEMTAERWSEIRRSANVDGDALRQLFAELRRHVRESDCMNSNPAIEGYVDHAVICTIAGRAIRDIASCIDAHDGSDVTHRQGILGNTTLDELLSSPDRLQQFMERADSSVVGELPGLRSAIDQLFEYYDVSTNLSKLPVLESSTHNRLLVSLAFLGSLTSVGRVHLQRAALADAEGAWNKGLAKSVATFAAQRFNNSSVESDADATDFANSLPHFEKDIAVAQRVQRALKFLNNEITYDEL